MNRRNIMSFKPVAILVVSNHEPLDELMAPWKFFVPVEGYWGDVVTEEETFDYLRFKKDENGYGTTGLSGIITPMTGGKVMISN